MIKQQNPYMALWGKNTQGFIGVWSGTLWISVIFRTPVHGVQLVELWLFNDESGTKPKLVAKIFATNFGFVPDW